MCTVQRIGGSVRLGSRDVPVAGNASGIISVVTERMIVSLEPMRTQRFAVSFAINCCR